MKKSKTKQFSRGLIFLIMALISLLMGYAMIAIWLIAFAFIGFIIEIYFNQAKIKLTNKKGMKIFFIVMIAIYLVIILVKYFLFNEAIPILKISLAAVIVLVLYFFFNILDLDMKPKDYNNPSKWSITGLLGYFLCIISIATIIILMTYKMITIQIAIIGLVAFLVGIILIISNYRSSKKS